MSCGKFSQTSEMYTYKCHRKYNRVYRNMVETLTSRLPPNKIKAKIPKYLLNSIKIFLHLKIDECNRKAFNELRQSLRFKPKSEHVIKKENKPDETVNN